jgi:hypothetical protein
MAEASNTVDHLVFKSKSITRTTRIDFASRKRIGELGIEEFCDSQVRSRISADLSTIEYPPPAEAMAMLEKGVKQTKVVN